MAILAPSRAKMIAISLPMPLAAPVMMATLSLRRIAVALFHGFRLDSRATTLPRPSVRSAMMRRSPAESQVGAEVATGNDLEHGQAPTAPARDEQLERGRSGPGALQVDVVEVVSTSSQMRGVPVDMRNDLEEEVGLRQAALTARRDRPRCACSPWCRWRCAPGRSASVPTSVSISTLSCGVGELLGKAPQLAAAGDRRMVVEEHAMACSRPCGAAWKRTGMTWPLSV